MKLKRQLKKIAGAVLSLALVLTLLPSVPVQASIFDDMNSAVQLEYEKNVSRIMESKDDADWFYFTTKDYAANYSISVSNLSEKYYNALNYRIYDVDGNCLETNGTYWGQRGGTRNLKFKGNKNTTYYLKFYTGANNYAGSYEYVFHVSCEKEDADEVEDAKKIDLNKSYTGQIFTSADEDWFKVKTPKCKMTYSLQVSNQSKAYYNGLYYKMYDADMNRIYGTGSCLWGGGRYSKDEVQLEAGKTYYIRFYSSNTYESPYEYIFKVIANDIDSLGTPAISKASGTSKGFKASWNEVTDATGYQIRYSTNKNMSKAKTVNVSSTSKKITKLNGKTKYYVQVRAYAKLSTGKKLYSKWSSKSKVTTK